MSDPSELAPVSVIIPCFRCKQTLARAVESVANQSFLPAEVILIDDCSGDETRELMQSLAGRYRAGWIRLVFLDQNMGAASARNAGWSVATQEYIAFLDSDDAWHPEKVRLQLGYMKSNPTVALTGHLHKLLPADQKPAWDLPDPGEKLTGRAITKSSLLLANRFVTPSAMLKRDLPVRFMDHQRYMEDHMLWLNIVFSGLRAELLKLPLAAIYKPAYGRSGLSAKWLQMERGDLGNYRRLMGKGYISRTAFLGFAAYSVAKFLRRLVLYNWNLVFNKST